MTNEFDWQLAAIVDRELFPSKANWSVGNWFPHWLAISNCWQHFECLPQRTEAQLLQQCHHLQPRETISKSKAVLFQFQIHPGCLSYYEITESVWLGKSFFISPKWSYWEVSFTVIPMFVIWLGGSDSGQEWLNAGGTASGWPHFSSKACCRFNATWNT